MPRYTGINHIHINVSNLERALEFYCGALGFEIAGRRPPDKAWLNWGQYPPEETLWYHNLAITEVPERNDRYWERTGLNHFAVELESPAAVTALEQELRAKGVKIIRGPGTHTEDMTFHVYVADPDGNVIELMAKTTASDAALRATAEAAPPPGWKPKI